MTQAGPGPVTGPPDAGPTDAGPVVAVDSLDIALPLGDDRAFAACGVSLRVGRCGTVCPVGESGWGKSGVARVIMGTLQPHLAVCAGSVSFEGAPRLGNGMPHVAARARPGWR